MKNYFITGFNDKNIFNGDRFTPDIDLIMEDHGTDEHRTFGYVEDLNEAKRIVESNAQDINEGGYYKVVIIEGVNPGIYNCDERERIFYEWDDSEKKYKEFVPEDETLIYYNNLCGVG